MVHFSFSIPVEICKEAKDSLDMLVMVKQLVGDDIKRLKNLEYQKWGPTDDEHKDNNKKHGDNLMVELLAVERIKQITLIKRAIFLSEALDLFPESRLDSLTRQGDSDSSTDILNEGFLKDFVMSEDKLSSLADKDIFHEGFLFFSLIFDSFTTKFSSSLSLKVF